MKLVNARKIFSGLIICLGLIVMIVGGRAYAQSGLERMVVPEFDELYVAQSFKLPLAKKIYIADPSVKFSQEWVDEFRTLVNSRYQELIIRKYGETLKEQLTEALTEAGWEVVKNPTDETLLLKPMLVGLHIYAPNESSLRQTIVRNVGRAIVELDFQTPGGESFLRIIDRRQTKDTVGSPIVANRSNNLRYFKILMSDWSEDAVRYLSQVMAVAEDQSKAAAQ